MEKEQPITGYRNLSETEIALINEIKAKGQELALLVNKVELACLDGAEDIENQQVAEVFIAAGKMSLQTGLMQLTRAVARPNHF